MRGVASATSRSHRATERSSVGRTGTSTDETAEDRTVPTGAEAAGGNPLLYSLGGVLAVLVAGGLVALTLRRRQSPA